MVRYTVSLLFIGSHSWQRDHDDAQHQQRRFDVSCLRPCTRLFFLFRLLWSISGNLLSTKTVS